MSKEKLFTQYEWDANEDDWHALVDAWKRRAESAERQRDELADALRVYLQAGHKETRRAASVIAKAALAKVRR